MNSIQTKCLCAILYGLLGALHAAEPSAHVSFRTLGVDVLADDISYSSGGKNIPVTVNSQCRSAYYTYTGSLNQLVFFRLIEGNNGEKIKQPVATVDVSGLGKRPILVFLADERKSGTYRVLGFADSVKDVPPGGYRFLNLTKQRVGVVLEKEKLLIPPGGVGNVSSKPSAGGTACQVVVYGIIDNVPMAVYSSIWTWNEKRRSMVIVVPAPSRSSGIAVRCLPENVSNIPADEEPMPDSGKK
jgi:hypothetical protein